MSANDFVPVLGQQIAPSTTVPKSPLDGPTATKKPAAAVLTRTPRGLGDINTFGTDLVIQFTTDEDSKATRSEKGAKATTALVNLVSKLESTGLIVTTRPSSSKFKETIWVFIKAPPSLISTLQAEERSSTFIHGVSSTPDAGGAAQEGEGVSEADRIRLVYELLCNSTAQQGLGITPGVSEGEWKNVKSIFPLHCTSLNNDWLKDWTSKADWKVGFYMSEKDINRLLHHYGPSVALYFSFLSFYTTACLPIAIFGLGQWFLGRAFSLPYAIVVTLWSVCVVEAWRIKEKTLSKKFNTYNMSSLPRLRSLASPSASTRPWYIHDIRITSSLVPLILCGIFLASVITAIFVLEAFISHLYHGPGEKQFPLVPTLAFSLVVPQILGLYRKIALKLTQLEDHASVVGFEDSLTLKTFSLNSIVAYLNLFLSAYCYIPFGSQLMDVVDTTLFGMDHMQQDSIQEGITNVLANVTGVADGGPTASGDLGARLKPTGSDLIKPSRLQDQMFAYSVTANVVNTFTEFGLPILLRLFAAWRASGGDKKDELDEKSTSTKISAERKFLKQVESEAEKPALDLFTEYSEMVTQFGYLSLWSIIYPINGLTSFINNYIELRTDAFKICRSLRRPIPARAESLGPWLTSMTFIAWFGSLTNATLYWLFSPPSHGHGSTFRSTVLNPSLGPPSVGGTLFPLILIALSASHIQIIVRSGIAYLFKRLLWDGSEAAKELEEEELDIRKEWVEQHAPVKRHIVDRGAGGGDEESDAFWVKSDGSHLKED